MIQARSRAEILRAAELIRRACASEAARRDTSVILKSDAAALNREFLLWAAGEDNGVVELLAGMDQIVAATDFFKSARAGNKPGRQ